MGFFKKIGKKIGIVKEENRTEEINEQRGNIKYEIAVKLQKKGFKEEDIKTVIGVIEKAENDIQNIKDSLIGTNINQEGDPNEKLHKGLEEIRTRQQQMQDEIQKTIQQLSEKYKK